MHVDRRYCEQNAGSSADSRNLRGWAPVPIPADEVMGWNIDDSGMAEIDRNLEQTIKGPVGPEFMAAPDRVVA